MEKGVQGPMRAAFAVAVILSIAIIVIAPSGRAEPTIVWSKAGGPYTISGQFHVPSGTTLIIEPGTVVRFERDASIYAEGPVLAVGEPSDNILFTSASNPPATNDWYGIVLRGGGEVRNAVSEYAFFGLYVQSDVVVDGVIVRNNAHGIYSLRCNPSVSHVSAVNNTLAGIYNDHAAGTISDIDISGSMWGIYLYAFGSDARIDRVRVHDMIPDSYGLTSIYNRPVVADSSFSARYDIFVPSTNSNVTLVNTSFGSVRMGYYNAVYVYNLMRVGAFDSVKGTPLPGADVRIFDATGAKYATQGYGGGDPRTGPDGFARWVLLFDWSFDYGIKVQSNAMVTAKYRTQEQVRVVDVIYLQEERFAFRGNCQPVAVIDAYQELPFSISMTGRKSNSLDARISEGGVEVYEAKIVRDAGPPDVAQGVLKVRAEMDYVLDLAYSGNVGSNPVKLSFGRTERQVVFNSEKGKVQTLSIPLDQTLAKALMCHKQWTFDGSMSYDPDGSIVEYLWDFGDGTSASGAIVEHTFTKRGTYDVTLTVRDDAGDTSSSHLLIVIA